MTRSMIAWSSRYWRSRQPSCQTSWKEFSATATNSSAIANKTRRFWSSATKTCYKIWSRGMSWSTKRPQSFSGSHSAIAQLQTRKHPWLAKVSCRQVWPMQAKCTTNRGSALAHLPSKLVSVASCSSSTQHLGRSLGCQPWLESPSQQWAHKLPARSQPRANLNSGIRAYRKFLTTAILTDWGPCMTSLAHRAWVGEESPQPTIAISTNSRSTFRSKALTCVIHMKTRNLRNYRRSWRIRAVSLMVKKAAKMLRLRCKRRMEFCLCRAMFRRFEL